MKTTPFLTCLGYYGISTGAADSIEAIYAFDSGNSQLVFNQLYPTGQHYLNNIIYDGVDPLLSLGRTPTRNHFTANHCYRVGYQHSGNFGAFLDIEYSGCQQTTNNLNVLVSTARDFPALNSGFFVGITPSHRLFCRTSGLTAHVSKELTTRDLVYVSLSESRYIDFGVYNVGEQKFYRQSVDVGSQRLTSPDLYVGGMLSSANPSNPSFLYTGYTGLINNMVLFKNPITDTDIEICADCNFVTGYSVTNNNQTVLSNYITGSYWSGSYDNVITGYQILTGNVLTSSGTTITVAYQSGVRANILTGEAIIPLTQTGNYVVNRSGYQFFNDTQALNSITKVNVEFDIPLLSGDYVEIYTYPSYNPAIQKELVNGYFADETGSPQLIGNGLYENSGIDYYAVHGTISGFDENDVLRYDVLTNNTVITDYSGYWQSNRIALFGGSSYFPPTAQYFESGNIVYVSNIPTVTQNNLNPNFGFDLYMNGQKLISGLQYNIRGGELVASGDYLLDAGGGLILDISGNPILGSSGISYSYVGSGFTVLLSGDLPAFTATNMYSGVQVTGVEDVRASELMFVPQYSGFNRYLLNVTSTQSTLSDITGFSEQIWVNGVRQTNIVDYVKHKPCELVTGLFDAPNVNFNVFDANVASIDVALPLVPVLWAPIQDGPGSTCTDYFDAYFEYECPLDDPYGGGLIEAWGRIDGGPYSIIGYGSPDPYNYIPWLCVAQGESVLDVRMRYRKGNIVGPFSNTASISLTL